MELDRAIFWDGPALNDLVFGLGFLREALLERFFGGLTTTPVLSGLSGLVLRGQTAAAERRGPCAVLAFSIHHQALFRNLSVFVLDLELNRLAQGPAIRFSIQAPLKS